MTRQKGRVRHLPSGKWQGKYRDALGKEQTAGTFVRKQAAECAALMEIAKIDAGVWEDPNMGKERFSSFAAGYLVLRRGDGTGLTPKSDIDLAGSIRNHLDPYFGPAQLRTIKRVDVQKWASIWMPGNGASPKTIRKRLRYLRAILQEAFEQEQIARNPARGIPVKTSAPKKRKVILTPAQLLTLADTITPRFAPWFFSLGLSD